MTKIKHISHIEDLLFDEGYSGGIKAISIIRDMAEHFRGTKKDHISISTKWDGAPSIFAGTDPETGEFFVSTKSIFNKDPVVFKSEKEVYENIENEHLASKLKLALKHFPKLNIKGVLQGDFLFSKEDVYETKIDGQSYIAFHTNTIVYAVPKESKRAAQITSAELGVVWHTSYRGQTLESMQANIGSEISSHLEETKEIWSVDPTYDHDLINLSFAEYDRIIENFNEIYRRLDSVKYKLDEISEDKNFLKLVHKFINRQIRSNELVHIRTFLSYLNEDMKKEMSKRKTYKGKISVLECYKKMISLLDYDMQSIFEIHQKIQNIKDEMIIVFDLHHEIETFIFSDEGHSPHRHEGYVITFHDHIIKFVDRNSFSWANFSSNVKRGFELVTE